MRNSVQTPPSPSAGAWLTRLMEQRGTSVQHVAEALGVTEKTVYYWRNDKTTVSEERIPRLAEVLGVSEIEARRGLGYWVPEEGDSHRPARNPEELDQIIEDLTAVLDRFRKWRRGV